MDIEKIENTGSTENGISQRTDEVIDKGLKFLGTKKGLLIIISMIFSTVGGIAGPMLLRLYYLHGGTQNWITSWVQNVGCPILLVPIAILYWREGRPGVNFLISTKLMMWSVGLGIISGLVSYLSSIGSSYIPVTTSQLLMSTQLVFTCVFALAVVRQKFTSYTINAVVILTMSAVLLGLRKSDDQPTDVSNEHYSLGFFLTLAAAALNGLMLPCSEYAYGSSKKEITYSLMLQFLLGVSIVATVFCTIGMLLYKDFQEIPREAEEFGLGATKYYIILASSAIVWQLVALGTFGLICWTSSIFVGVFGAALLPLSEVAGVIAFKEKFSGEKGMTVVLCIWGFTSYFYGSYKKSKKQNSGITFSG